MEHHQMNHAFSLQSSFQLLFEEVHISSTKDIVIAMMIVAAGSILFECLNFTLHLREHHRDYNMKQVKSNYRYHRTCYQLVSSLCRMISAALAYLIMLCVMTMSIWLLISVVLGSGLGHLFTRPLLIRMFKQTPLEEKDEIKEDIELLTGKTTYNENDVPDVKTILLTNSNENVWIRQTDLD